MSVRFNAEEPYTATNGVIGTSNFTMLCWGRIAVDRNTYATFMSLDTAQVGDEPAVMAQTQVDGTTLTLFSDSGTTTPASSGMTVGSWYRMALVKDGTTCTLIRAAATGSSTSAGLTLTGTYDLDRLQIGTSPYADEWLNGNVANFKLYNAVLTQTEIEAEWDNWQAQRTANLVRHHKFQTAAETTDYSGNGNALTASGTPTFEATNPTISDSLPTGLAVHVSSPARATGAATNGTVAVTTATFDPPAALLVATVQCNDRNIPGGQTGASGAITNNGAALTWTTVGERNVDDVGGTNGYVGIFVARLTSARTGLTVTFTATPGSGDANTINTPTIKLYVVTGADIINPVGASTAGTSTTNNLTTDAFTTVKASSMGFVAGTDWNALGAPTSSDCTVDSMHNGASISVTSGYKTLSTAGSSATFNLDAGGAGAAAWNWISFEVVARVAVSVPLTHVGSTSWVAPASSATVSPTYPSGIQAGDCIYAILHIKPDTATVATPTNWSLVTSAAGGSGTQGGGTGATRVHLYRRIATAGHSGTEAFTITGGSSPVGFMRAYRATGTNVTFEAETTTSWSVTTASTTIGGTAGAGLDLAPLDEINCILGASDDAATTLTLTGLTATSATLGTLTRDPNATVINAQGNQISATAYRIPVTAGTSNTAPVATATSNSSETAMGFLFRVRAIADIDSYPPLYQPYTARRRATNW